MTIDNKTYITELMWDDARKYLLPLNPELTTIIDKLSPNKNHTIFKVSYCYGDNLLQNNAEFFLPSKSGLVAITDASVSTHIKKKLGYNFQSNPIGIVLKNSFELFISLKERVIPFGLIRPGRVFGLWRLFDEGITFAPRNFPWGLTAGARSLFMLAKISEQKRHQRLKHTFNLSPDKPQDLKDHHAIFSSIANHKMHGEPWMADILFFSNDWFEHRNDSAWLEFNYYLLNKTWQGSSYWRNQFIWNIVFSLIQNKKLIKPSPYIIDIVKHLLGLASGVIPGFQSAPNDNFAPISRIKTAYDEIYKMSYPSVIMQPTYFSMFERGQPVYYSLQYPTSFETHLKANAKTTALTDLYETMSLLEKYIDEIHKNWPDLDSKVPFFKLATLVKFEAFHPHQNGNRYIKSSEHLTREEQNFHELPKNVGFFNGCIQISNK